MNNTDNMEEMFTIVDENDNVIGKATRRECHSNNKIIHRGVHVNFINGNRILLQKRSKKKDVDSGKFDSSVGGHTSYGETYKQTAIRETKEELGINIKEKNLIPIGKTFHNIKKEREIDMNFIVKTNLIPDKIKFNTNEVSDVFYIDVEKVKKMLRDDKNQFTKCFPQVFNLLCKHFGW
jgi:isopentenyl-diphosphate delta-isomerase type 1